VDLTRIVTSIFVAVCIAAAGCTDQHQAPTSNHPAPAPFHQTPPKVPVSYGPTLRGMLPEDTLAYVRIPNPWGLLFSPKGDVLDQAFAGAAQADAVLAVQKQFYGQLLKDGAKPNALNELLLRRLRSPLELALLPPGEAQPPMPNLYATARLDTADENAVNTMLREFVAAAPNLKLVRPIEAQNNATLLVGPLAIYVHFDAATQRLSLMAGTGLTERAFDATRTGLKPTHHDTLAAMESRIDTSGQGMFAWADVAGLITLAKPMLPPDKLHRIEASPIQHVRSIALGWGVADKKGRLRIEARLDQKGLRQYVSVPGKGLTLNAAGEPTSVVIMALPGTEQLNNIKRLIAERGGTAKYAKFDARLRQDAGVSLEDLSAAVGPEWVAVNDRAGQYAAVRVRDDKRWQQLVDNLTRATGSPGGTTEVGGHIIHQLVLPTLLSAGGNAAKPPTAAARVLGHIRSHVYWTKDGDYIVFAALPQILRDRAAYPTHMPVAGWLRNVQHQDPSTGVVTLSASLRDSPRQLYYAYLNLMEMAGDIAGVPVDIGRLPSAAQLQLPERGGVGLQAQVENDDVALELSFDSNPAEVLAGGGNAMTTVAVVGIMAAIAIPAYQAYMLRSRVAMAYDFGVAALPLMDRYRARHGRWPDAQALAGLKPPAALQPYLADLSVDTETGTLVMTLKGNPQLEGRQLTFTFDSKEGPAGWRCTSDLPPKYVPKRCR